MAEPQTHRFRRPPPQPSPAAPDLPTEMADLPFLRQAWATPLEVPDPDSDGSSAWPPPARPSPATPAAQPAEASVEEPTPWRRLDWPLVRRLRVEAAERRDAHEWPDPATAREFTRSVVVQLVNDHARRAVASGGDVLSAADMQATATAVMDSLYGLGRFQPLVDIPTAENVEIRGGEPVLIEHHDSVLERGAPVADSDAELVETLRLLNSQMGAHARPFNHGWPFLDLSLPGNVRLSAVNWVTGTPQVWLRLHRLPRLTLDDAVARQMLTPPMAAFLSAAVRAKLSILVCGPQGVGKTTFTRALVQVIDPRESIVTIEGERELFIDKIPGYDRVTSVETRPGTGEVDSTGRPLGVITADQAMLQSLRWNANRIIVGEVRGPEITAMVKVMESGAGGMATTHAKSARHAIGRLATLIQEAQPATSYQVARRKLAEQLQLIVHLDMTTVTAADGTTSRRRFVSEVVAVEPSESGDVSVTTVFGAQAQPVPHWMVHAVAAFGYDARRHDGTLS